MTVQNTKVKDFLRTRLTRPLLELLKQGVTPDKLALSVALGAALGIAPLRCCADWLPCSCA